MAKVLTFISNHKKLTIASSIVIFFIVLLIVADVYQSNKEKDIENVDVEEQEPNADSEFAIEQQSYIDKWGPPKEGFIWTDDGQLQAIGSIDKTPEDVIYNYVRSLSTLDFANAQRYSYKSQTINTYKGYYSSESEFSYNNNFTRNMYKEVLLSMKPNKIVDMATFADFRQAVTMDIELLDLQNKEFWYPDRDKLFSELRKYSLAERDTTKMKEFLYNYVLEYYTSPEPKTRIVKVNFVLEQTVEGAWLVTNDSDLDAIAKYQDGETVITQILDEFDDYMSSLDLTRSDVSDSKETDNADELLDHDGGNYEESGSVEYSPRAGNNDDTGFTDEPVKDDGDFNNE